MKFTLSWLKDHLDTSASLDEIADKLTLIGLEVEALVDPSETFANFEVAEIIATAPHPEADRLQICTVKSGGGEQQLVCGAPNARPASSVYWRRKARSYRPAAWFLARRKFAVSKAAA